MSKSDGPSTEFEKKTALLFTFLGYEVGSLGQGKGRVQDAIVKGLGYNDRQIAFLVDCKARKDLNYSINSADKRALIEYSNTFFRNYKNKGKDVYLLIVSSGFSNAQDRAIKSIKSSTRIKGIILLETQELLKILYKRLTNADFDVAAICDELTDKER